MKKLLFFCSWSLFASTSFAEGIQFKDGNWKDIVAKAKSEHKLIYMDIYTTWCGPCKIMASTIFPMDEAGKLYNQTFVNYKIDAEKGEGLELAKKYNITGYPTNLYINPDNQEVVYRVMGSTDIKSFVERGNTAVAEYKDPMKWDDYVSKFKKGDKSKSFLLSYMTKAERLNKYNDDALNVYVAQLDPQKLDDASWMSLVGFTHTLDNNAVPFILSNKEKVNKLYKEPKNYIDEWLTDLPYNTMEKAIDLKDEHLLNVIRDGITKYEIQQSPSSKYYYQKEYFTKINDTARAWKISIEEADYLIALPENMLKEKDKEEAESAKNQILQQLKAMNVPQDKYASSLEATFKNNPEYLHGESYKVANTLNNTAWTVVAKNITTPVILSRAAKWSQRSLALTEGLKSWPMFADTYANILFLQGDKQRAIDTEEAVIQKTQQLSPDEDIQNYKETLAKFRGKE